MEALGSYGIGQNLCSPKKPKSLQKPTISASLVSSGFIGFPIIIALCHFLPALHLCFTTRVHLLHAIILGAIEGMTEFLPISSTAHLILASRLLGLSQTDFQTTFEIFIQLGSILAVVVFYGKSLLRDRATFMRVAVAFVPTAIIGLVLQKIIMHIFFGSLAVVLWALFLGGIILILFERWHREKPSDARSLERITYKQAFLIGCFQALAVVPGVSRAAATIVGGQLVGVERKTIVDFSFLLAIPTMIAATGLDLIKSPHNFSGSQLGLLAVGFLVSFAVALLAIRWFLAYIKNHSFAPFGVYRIAVALIFSIGLLF
jgi:undecaprenyl-diphosphatase